MVIVQNCDSTNKKKVKTTDVAHLETIPILFWEHAHISFQKFYCLLDITYIQNGKYKMGLYYQCCLVI